VVTGGLVETFEQSIRCNLLQGCDFEDADLFPYF